ncbi:hypothetical protein V5F77_23490 [Xanthobacter sp. DSM 24535]|uniref:Uncharacterized protein n=1 Tax=Aquabacter spiritensis TaxID=933073 RepID=A0A4R3LNW6_9HYPH|nr:hypothetical protein [Aquabacter spiritensis]TCT01851.1 hypothetical protein EDC64_11648 [Aquabacter spiritensis]
MKTVIDIHAEIAELRAELAHCMLTVKERKETLRQLNDMLVEAERRRTEAEGA